jgi:hypothetical protein
MELVSRGGEYINERRLVHAISLYLLLTGGDSCVIFETGLEGNVLVVFLESTTR